MNRIPQELKVSIPAERTALYPAERRDESRLLVIDRARKRVIDVGLFGEIVEYIKGDLVVVNETRVVPARVEGKRPGGGKVEVLFLTIDNTLPLSPPAIADKGCDKNTTPPLSPPAIAGGECVEVQALISPGRRLRKGLIISLPLEAQLCLIEKDADGRWHGIWSCNSKEQTLHNWLEDAGTPPLPPYIRRKPEALDRERYQTSYARLPGSLAAPTAGFHFTPELLDRLKVTDCDIVTLTLDVGIGTFLPIRTDILAEHRMHHEYYNIPEETATSIARAKNRGRNVTAVGTTVVRALEAAAGEESHLQSGKRIADIFIYPPYSFRIIDRLLTNFHRPDSTLIQLVAAMIGWDLVNLAYQTALNNGFRFYSYGDAMLII